MSEMRRLCASPEGCQGVTLVEAITRPECVGEDIMLCRFRQSVQVGTMEQLVVCAPGLKCLKFCWPAVKDEYGNTVLPTTLCKPQDLLGPKRSGCKEALCYPDSNVGAGRRRGVAVIVGMVKYTSKYGDRSGGRDDEAKLTTLIDELQFEVKLLQDLTAGELQGEIKEIATTSILPQDESFLCFVMGHGNSTFDGEQCVLDQNGDIIMEDDIVRPFTTCQHLHGKPKVFFVISCRGRHVPLLPQPGWNEGTELRYLEEFPDCLIVFSAAVGTVSVWRHAFCQGLGCKLQHGQPADDGCFGNPHSCEKGG